MISDESPSQSPRRESVPPRGHGGTAQDGDGPTEHYGRGRIVLTVLAVAFAVIGLLSLGAILVTAFFQGTVWPGFVLASYFCLPIAFLLMAALVVWSVVVRRRS
jgi:hypothetical protein